MSLIDTKFGFDDKLFQLFLKHITAKPERKRHSIIVFDKMSVRESLEICSKYLTYQESIDFGSELNIPMPKTIDDKANTNAALVFLFQPLSAKYAQPFAVFGSRGPVNGTVLI